MMHVPAMVQSGDKQNVALQGSGRGQLNFSTDSFGSFYYFEEPGMNVTLPQLAQTGVIAPEAYEVSSDDMFTLDFRREFSGTMKGLLVNSSGKSATAMFSLLLMWPLPDNFEIQPTCLFREKPRFS
jgi:hypothetical protein